MPVDKSGEGASLMLQGLLKGNPLVGDLAEVVAMEAQSGKKIIYFSL